MNKIGQVSLPVLSRKGKYDYWSNNWATKKNYSLYFSEDIFLKKFMFSFLMHTVSKNKHFSDIFFKKISFFKNKNNLNSYSLAEFDKSNIYKIINNKPINKYFLSNVYLCKHLNWVIIYIYIYSITNVKFKDVFKKKSTNYYNTELLYQAYLFSKKKYTLTNVK